VNSEDMAPEAKQVWAVRQATIYALLDHFDSGGFGGLFVYLGSASQQ